MAERKISTKFAISGESEYRNAVKNINSEMKTLNSEMARVTSEFLNNRNSMEALSAEGKVLVDQWTLQYDRVSTLRDALQNAQAAQAEWSEKAEEAKQRVGALTEELEALEQAEGDTSEEQARLREELARATEAQEAAERGYEAATKGVEDWQVRLNYAEADLNKLSAKVDENNRLMAEAKASSDQCATSIDQYGKAVGNTAEQSNILGDIGSAAFGKIAGSLTTGGLIGFALKLLDTVKDLAVEMKNAEVIMARGTGAQGEALQELNGIYREVMANAKSASEAVAGSIAALSTRLDLNGKALEENALLFEKFARATKTDAAEGVELVADLLYTFDRDVSDIPRILDALTAAAQNSDASVTKLSSSVSESAFYSKQYGLSLEDTIALMAAYEKAGIDSSVVARGLKKSYDDVTSSGKTFKQVMAELRDGTLSAEDAIDLFGAKGANLATVLQNGRVDVDAMTEAITNADGRMEKTAEAAETFGDKWKGFWNNLWYASDAAGSQYTGFYTIVTEENEEIAESFEERVIPTFEEALATLIEMALAADGTAESIDKLTEYLDSNDAQALRSVDGYGQLRDALSEAKAQMALLESETGKATEAVASTLDSMMGRFNKVPPTVAQSTVGVIASLQSQMTYMEQYAQNMQAAAARGVDEGLLKSLSDGSDESAAILAGLVEATDGEIAILNEKWNQTQTGKENFSRTMGEIQTDFEKRSEALQEEYQNAVESFNRYAEAHAAGAKTLRGVIDGAVSMGGHVNQSYYKMGRDAHQAYNDGFNSIGPVKTGYASGTDYASAGLHWVGENGPELMMMRGGETVFNHADSMQLAREAMAAAVRAQSRAETADMATPVIRETVIVNLDTKGIVDRIDGVIDAVEAQEPISFSAIVDGISGELGRENDLRLWSGG